MNVEDFKNKWMPNREFGRVMPVNSMMFWGDLFDLLREMERSAANLQKPKTCSAQESDAVIEWSGWEKTVKIMIGKDGPPRYLNMQVFKAFGEQAPLMQHTFGLVGEPGEQRLGLPRYR